MSASVRKENPSKSRAQEAHDNTVLVWQAEMASKEVTMVTKSCSGETKATWMRPLSYHQAAIRDTQDLRAMSIERRNSPSAARRLSVRDDRQRGERDRRKTRPAMEDVQPRTHRGGSKPSTATSQRVGSVPMMRSSVPMAGPIHRRDQDVVFAGSQFESDVLVEEFIELDGWVVL